MGSVDFDMHTTAFVSKPLVYFKDCQKNCFRLENNYVLSDEPTPGDGSCLAHALVDQMRHDPILSLNRIDHQQFRRFVKQTL